MYWMQRIPTVGYTGVCHTPWYEYRCWISTTSWRWRRQWWWNRNQVGLCMFSVNRQDADTQYFTVRFQLNNQSISQTLQNLHENGALRVAVRICNVLLVICRWHKNYQCDTERRALSPQQLGLSSAETAYVGVMRRLFSALHCTSLTQRLLRYLMLFALEM